jgi:hypothetical protein
MAERKRLSDILPLNSEREKLEDAWDSTKPADDLKPLPSGEYRCAVLCGELFTAKSGTAGYKLTLEVIDGEHAGRRVWHDIWLTPAAMAMAKRDLGKLGVVQLEQLERPLPEGITVAAKIALRKDDDGQEFNRVRSFDVVAIEPPEPDAFAMQSTGSNGEADRDDAAGSTVDDQGYDWGKGEQTR